jgi:hypothetical protein
MLNQDYYEPLRTECEYGVSTMRQMCLLSDYILDIFSNRHGDTQYSSQCESYTSWTSQCCRSVSSPLVVGAC